MIKNLTVPQNEKERQEWGDEILDNVSVYSSSESWNKTRYNYAENQRRFNGDLSPEDYEYITHTLGKPKPMHFANYPLLEPLMQGMVGRYTSRPVPFSINRVNKNAYSSKMNLLGQMAAESLLEPIYKKAEKMMGMKLPIEKKLELIPDQFKSMPHKSLRDSLEINLKYAINYLYYTYNFQDELSKALYTILINSDVMGKIEMVGNDPVIEHVPIQNCIFQKGEGNYVFDKIHRRSPFIGKDVFMSLSEIMYKYGHALKTLQKKKLMSEQEELHKGGQQLIDGWNRDFGLCCRMHDGGVMFRVVDIEVKAHDEKRFLRIPYRPGSDDVYKSGNLDQIYELTKIGKDCYLKPRRRRNQIPLKGDYTDLQHSYFGMLSKHSFYDRAFPVQLLYSNCLMTLDFLLNQSGGKATRYATERKPDDYELEDVAYSAKVLGLVVEQIRAGDIPGRSTSGGEIDYGPSASIQYIIALSTMLSQTAQRMTGMTDAPAGRAASTSPVGTVQSNIEQSSYMTKPVFDVHSAFTEIGLQRCADLVRYLWEPDETKAYFGGDGMQHVFKVSKDFKLSAAGIYVQSSVKINQDKEFMLSIGKETLATEATMLLEVIKMYNAETGAEAEQILELGIGAIRANKEKMEQQKLQIMSQGNEVASRANDLKEEELFIRKTVPVNVEKIRKSGAENVAMINSEAQENETMFKELSSRDQLLMEQQAEAEQMEKDRQQEMRQPAAAPAQ